MVSKEFVLGLISLTFLLSLGVMYRRGSQTLNDNYILLWLGCIWSHLFPTVVWYNVTELSYLWLNGGNAALSVVLFIVFTSDMLDNIDNKDKDNE